MRYRRQKSCAPKKHCIFPQIIQTILFGVHSAWKQQYDIEDRQVTPQKIRYKSAICDNFPVNLNAVQKIEKSAETRRGSFFPKSHSLELLFLVLKVLCQSLCLSSPTCDEAVVQIWLLYICTSSQLGLSVRSRHFGVLATWKHHIFGVDDGIQLVHALSFLPICPFLSSVSPCYLPCFVPKHGDYKIQGPSRKYLI